MRTRLLWMLLAVAIAAGLRAGPRDAEWDKVREAAKAGLPKTAIEALEPILAASTADKAYSEMVRALTWKIALEGGIEGNKPEEKIVRLQAAMANAPAEAKPILETILAEWYWQFFQRNRWRFLQRTQTSAPAGADLQTWDLARILDEIDVHFTAALAEAETLQRIPVADYNDLLVPGSMPDVYRPTLFDFLAHEALKFYQAGEQGVRVAENRAELAADGPIFAGAAEFLEWQPPAASDAPVLKAVHLYQQLLRFHAADADRSAYFDVDLDRLTYGFNVAVGEAKTARYQTALERFIAETAGHEIQGRARAALAEALRAEGNLVAAHEQAQRGAAAYPRSPGAAQCFNLVKEIEAPSARLETESVWNAPWPTLDVTYRNVTRVYFRAIAMDFENYLSRVQWNFGSAGTKQFPELLASATYSWDAELPATADFNERTERLPAPTSLKPGFYAIVASHDPTFSETDNQVSVAMVWVSDLALVLRADSAHGRRGGMVLSAASGEPVAGATVRFWRRDAKGQFAAHGQTRSDADGRFSVSGDDAVVVLAGHGGQAVSSWNVVNAVREARRREATEHTVFFTDRAIYRPGQAIYYKGICVDPDERRGSGEVLAHERVTVIFRDPNGDEIARASHVTNDYGSFSGVFTAPRGRLLGRMTIAVDRGPDGTAAFSVEEYKRPKFHVALEAPAEAAKLDESVVLTGRAMAYSGAPIGEARVQWRVERGTRMPLWCWWWLPRPPQPVAHGTAVTAADGTFRIEFPATPDRAISASDEPVFVFNVDADVTDGAGETRSAGRQVLAGYTALQAAITADEWQTPERPVELAITTRSLDGDPQAANGTVTIYALQQPARVQRAALSTDYRWWAGPNEKPPSDPSDPRTWEDGEPVSKLDFRTDSSGDAQVAAPLQPGIYRAVLETTDRFGRSVTARQEVEVVDPAATAYRVKRPSHFAARSWSVEPGETFTALWGTGYESGRAFVEVECNGRLLQSYWTSPGRTQQRIEQPVTEAMRGGFTVRVSYVRENRAYVSQRVVDVPWSNKQLSVKWEHFRSKLLPGEKETWTAVVSGPDAKRASAELVATLYDASLDQFTSLNWPTAIGSFRREIGSIQVSFQNVRRPFNHLQGSWQIPRRDVALDYRRFPDEIISSLWGGLGRGDVIELSPFQVASSENAGYRASATLAGTRLRSDLKDLAGSISVVTAQKMEAEEPEPKPDLEKVAARTNLNETAFFFPHLEAGDDGVVRMTFTMPEALTEWKFLGFAHDAQLRSGLLTDRVVTAKDLMVQPNPPRFVREGDAIEFTVKISNQSQQPQRGTVRLTFADAASQRSVDAALGNDANEQAFDVPPQQSRTYAWRIAVPDGLGFLTYKAVAASAELSDGEEGYLPVLSRRVLVTESLPLSIRGPATKEFAFEKLLGSGVSDTLRHESLTVQMTSQPAWYAVMALPYLMEFPHECSEQLFNRVYANLVARDIARSDPKVRRIFELWRNTPALDSPLEKNAELKSVTIEETPWLRNAHSESEAHRRLGVLFEDNRLDEEIASGLRRLAEQQLPDGLWPWFSGGRANEYISLYIATGFGRLRHLGIDIDAEPAIKALAALDAWAQERYRRIAQEKEPEKYVPSATDALYLYGRSFFIEDQPLTPETKEAVDFLLRQARANWLQVSARQSQAHLAIALQRFGDAQAAQTILRSIKERSVTNEEFGRFWRDLESRWHWQDAPIETQALMIEAFDEVAHDASGVEECKIWLLKQKQTQHWSTTKATADAIYALLLRGRNLLARDSVVEVSLGSETIAPKNVEAGTGFYEQRFAGGEVTPAMGRVVVKKTDEGVSWGGVHWQYLEDIAKIAPHEATPLRLKKTLFVKEATAQGRVLKPVNGPLAVGDELVVRIELSTDRDLEFVHLKDQRGSGTEPVNVLSGYRYQDGLGYYESTRDTASHFFIDRLQRGTYVFEYSSRVQLRGRYQSGLAEIECMYAPEFRSHSESRELVVE